MQSTSVDFEASLAWSNVNKVDVIERKTFKSELSLQIPGLEPTDDDGVTGAFECGIRCSGRCQ